MVQCRPATGLSATPFCRKVPCHFHQMVPYHFVGKWPCHFVGMKFHQVVPHHFVGRYPAILLAGQIGCARAQHAVMDAL